MSKFKVGDIITIRSDLYETVRGVTVHDGMLKYRGKTARIEMVEYSDCAELGYTYRLDNIRFYWEDWMFEKETHVEKQDVTDGFTKKDLKVGMLLEFNIGSDYEYRAIVMPSHENGNVLYLIDNDYDNIKLDDFDDNLSDGCVKLVKVYSAPVIVNGCDLFEVANRDLLWSKKREMTVKEIEELLGYEIKIVA